MTVVDDTLERWMLAALKGTGVSVAALVLPFLVYGVLAWNRMGLFVPSGYMPLEALNAALEQGPIAAIWAAPVASLNATSGELVSVMYDVTVGSLVLALALGLAVTLQGLRPRACNRAAGGWLAGGGLLASIGGAPTVMLGCCGGGAAGAILALAGLTSATAAEISVLGQPLQAAIIAALLLRAMWPNLPGDRARLPPRRFAADASRP